MPAQRIADRSEMCPTCDALVAGLSALLAERQGVLPSLAEIRRRAGVSEQAAVAHVGSAADCFVLAFERATDRLYAGVVAQLSDDEARTAERVADAVRTELETLDPRLPTGSVILSADRLNDPAIRAALATWERRLGLTPTDAGDGSEPAASGSGLHVRGAREAPRLGAAATPATSRRSGRSWLPRTASEPAP